MSTCNNSNIMSHQANLRATLSEYFLKTTKKFTTKELNFRTKYKIQKITKSEKREGENIIVCSYLIHKSKGRFVHLCSKDCKIPTK